MASEAKGIDPAILPIAEHIRDFLDDAIEAAVEELEARVNELRKQLATERARHAAMAADYEKIATGTHPGYWMLEPGDVLFRPTGEVRKVRDREWLRNGDDRFICHRGYLTVSKFPIYRRIDVPADATKGNP